LQEYFNDPTTDDEGNTTNGLTIVDVSNEKLKENTTGYYTSLNN